MLAVFAKQGFVEASIADIPKAAGNDPINRRLAKAGHEDLQPLYFTWSTLRICHFTYTYCADHQARSYPEPFNKGVLDTERASGGARSCGPGRRRSTSVYFAGGEPTVRKDLPGLSRHAVEHGYGLLIVNTNGSPVARNLKQPNWRTRLADPDIIVVSLEAFDLGIPTDMWIDRKWI